MSVVLLAKLNALSLKLVPVLVIFYAIFNIYTSSIGYMTINDQSATYRLTSKARSRKSSFVANLVISCIVLFISSIYLYSIWRL